MAMTNREKAEALKDQHFGVEIEMYGITRKHASRVAAETLGGTYEFTQARNGYHTWSCLAPDGREWKFCRDSSIAADRDEEKCEMVTPILSYDDLGVLVNLVNALKESGARSDAGHVCGIHIHVDGAGHTGQTIKNLVNLVYSHEEQIAAALNMGEYREEHYCGMIKKDFHAALHKLKKPELLDIENLWYEGLLRRDNHYNSTRYRMLNLHSFFYGHGTVEFRCFQFQDETGIDTNELAAMIQMALALNSQAKVSIRCVSKKNTKSNTSKAMAGWLTRLGFVGNEFKFARRYWTRKTDRTLSKMFAGVFEYEAA